MTFFRALGPVDEGGGGTHASGTSSPTADSDLFDIALSSPTCKRHRHSSSQHRQVSQLLTGTRRTPTDGRAPATSTKLPHQGWVVTTND